MFNLIEDQRGPLTRFYELEFAKEAKFLRSINIKLTEEIVRERLSLPHPESKLRKFVSAVQSFVLF